MTILYIGNCDTLASEIVNCFRKEGDRVYLLAGGDFVDENRPKLSYKVYLVKGGYADAEKYFININPELVIFSGELYLKQDWRQENQAGMFLQQLLHVLNFCALNGVKKFILLSSSRVLDKRMGEKKEDAAVHPSDYKGMIYAQAEDMVSLWGRTAQMDTVILRTDLVVGCNVWEKTGDLTEKIVRSFLTEGSYTVEQERIYTPVSVKDLANAILRCAGMTLSGCYHAAGNEQISESEFARLINRVLDSRYRVEVKNEEGTHSYALCNERLKRELEWVPFYDTEETFLSGRVSFTAEGKKRRKRCKRVKTYAAFENLLLFLFVCAVSLPGSRNPVFARIDLMAPYVLLAGLIFGMRQSVLSVIYACAFYTLSSYGRNISPIVILTDVGTLLQFTVYIFIGVAAGYTVDHYRLRIDERNTEYRFLEREFEAISEINQDNFMVKQEYQKRLLEYKTSLPKLYDVISRLTVLEPEQIFSETIRAVKEVMEVETVAVYLAKEGSPYLRLIVSSGEDAVFSGKSWKLDDYPEIKKTFGQDEIYIGKMRSAKEPALAAPVYYRGSCIAALVIKEVPFRFLNLNYTNLFRTLAVMITSSIVKAKDYENSVRRNLCLPETEIYYPCEFGKLLRIEREKKAQDTADYSVLRMSVEQSAETTYLETANLFRNTDFFGLDDEGNLYILLGNTPEKDTRYVLERLEAKGFAAVIVPYEELEAIGFTRDVTKRGEETP